MIFRENLLCYQPVMKVIKTNSEDQSLTNKVIVNGADLVPSKVPHVKITTMPGVSYVLSTLEDSSVPPGSLGFGVNIRKWAALSIGAKTQRMIEKTEIAAKVLPSWPK